MTRTTERTGYAPTKRADMATRPERAGPIDRQAAGRGLVGFLALVAATTVGAVALNAAQPALVPFLLALVPALIAMGLAWREGDGALRDLLRGVVTRPTDRRWYLVLLLPVAWALLVVTVSLLLGAAPDGPFHGVTASALIVPLVVLIPAVAEELAWRGYALQRAVRLTSPVAACLLLGVPWSLLHVVLHLPGGMNASAAVWPAVASVLAYAVILGWIYLASGGSVLLVALVHAGLNSVVPFIAGIDPVVSWQVRAVVAVLLAVAVVVLGGFRGQDGETDHPGRRTATQG